MRHDELSPEWPAVKATVRASWIAPVVPKWCPFVGCSLRRENRKTSGEPRQRCRATGELLDPCFSQVTRKVVWARHCRVATSSRRRCFRVCRSFVTIAGTIIFWVRNVCAAKWTLTQPCSKVLSRVSYCRRCWSLLKAGRIGRYRWVLLDLLKRLCTTGTHHYISAAVFLNLTQNI